MKKLLAAGLLIASLAQPFGWASALHAETEGAVIFINAKKDGSFNELAAIGTERAAADFDLSVREWISTDEMETLQVLERYAAEGVAHIVSLGYGSSNVVRIVAQKYPDVKFTILDGVVTDLPNVRSVVFADEQSGFLAGYVAGRKTRSGIVGTIGGSDIPPVRRFMCGFAAGVKYASPDVTVRSAFVGLDDLAYRDIPGGKRAGAKMFAEGADVIFAPAGLASEGVAKAAEAAGAFVIMVDANKNGFIPGTVLTSALKRVDEATYASWKDVVEGTWTAGLLIMTAKENGIGWALDDHNRALVADFHLDVDAVTAALANGQIKIRPADGVSGCDEVL